MQNYSIVKDLTQEPCAMFALEILQNCLTQHKELLAYIGAYDSLDSNFFTFDVDKNKPPLPHYTSIQIQFNNDGSSIWRTIVDEGASTCIMSLTCLKAIDSIAFIPSPMMLKHFDGHTF